MNPEPLRIQVPATSANLGPGFDCLALALSLHNTFVFKVVEGPSSVEIEGHGHDSLPRDDSNLVLSAANRFFQEMGQDSPSLELVCRNEVPLASGLGSSAAAVVAGLTGANALLGNPMDQDSVIQLASALEGHPDNVAACVLGGLAVVRSDAQGMQTLAYEVPEQTVAVVVPQLATSTEEMRGILPQQIALESVVHNLAGVPFVIEALRRRDYEMLARAAEDRIHESHRLAHLPGAKQARTAALEAGAAAVVLSGAGPALLAFAPSAHSSIARAMRDAFQAGGVSALDFVLKTEPRGASVALIT